MSKNRGAKDRRPTRPASAPAAPPALKVKKRVAGNPADYLAAELHEERLNGMELRKQHLGLRQQLLAMQQLLLKKEDQILQLENAAVNERNKALREEHGLTVGRTVHKDDVTGEVYFIEEVEAEVPAPAPAPTEAPAEAAPEPELAGK